MAKLKVICNMIDKNTGVVRYAGDVFEVNDANRIKELLNAKVVEEIKASGLRGKGGAGFPTGIKWESASQTMEKLL